MATTIESRTTAGNGVVVLALDLRLLGPLPT